MIKSGKIFSNISTCIAKLIAKEKNIDIEINSGSILSSPFLFGNKFVENARQTATVRAPIVENLIVTIIIYVGLITFGLTGAIIAGVFSSVIMTVVAHSNVYKLGPKYQITIESEYFKYPETKNGIKYIMRKSIFKERIFIFSLFTGFSALAAGPAIIMLQVFGASNILELFVSGSGIIKGLLTIPATIAGFAAGVLGHSLLNLKQLNDNLKEYRYRGPLAKIFPGLII